MRWVFRHRKEEDKVRILWKRRKRTCGTAMVKRRLFETLIAGLLHEIAADGSVLRVLEKPSQPGDAGGTQDRLTTWA
jgi:hypothetical protein